MHHAYLLVGGVEEAKNFVEEKCGKLAGSPDFFSYELEVFGIDEARKVNEVAIRKAFTPRSDSGQAGRKVFLIAPERITLEAQNALLKTFEDPSPDTHFFLVVVDEGIIISTLRSRMATWRLNRQVAETHEAEKFLKLSLKYRLTFVKKFVEDEKNLSVFLDELLVLLKERNATDGLKEVYPLRLTSDGRTVSVRLILEHLSLVL